MNYMIWQHKKHKATQATLEQIKSFENWREILFMIERKGEFVDDYKRIEEYELKEERWS